MPIRTRPIAVGISLTALVLSILMASPAQASPDKDELSGKLESALAEHLRSGVADGRLVPLGSFSAPRNSKSSEVQAGPPTIFCFLSLVGPTLIDYGGSIPLKLILADGLVVCTYPIAYIGVAVQLQMAGVPLPYGADYQANSSTAHASTSAICTPNGWRAVTVAVLYAPAGYEPAVLDLSDSSPYANYDC